MKVAVVGLGAMGMQMAGWLTSQSFELVGYDISAERLAFAGEHSIATSGSASRAVDGADIVLVAVRNRAQFDELLHGDDGIAPKLKKGAEIILTSTIGISAVEEIAGNLKQIGVGLVDAPVSGGPVRAGKGDLLVTVGAYEHDYSAAEPVLKSIASTLVWVGKAPGRGQAMKTVNQLLAGVHIAAAAEAMALAGRLGLDQEKALAALMDGAAASFMLGDRGPRAIRQYEGEETEVKSRLDIFVKDMSIVTQAAKDCGLAVPVAAAAEQQYLLGIANGLEAYDDSAVIRVITPPEK